jgi:hypothetical protein
MYPFFNISFRLYLELTHLHHSLHQALIWAQALFVVELQESFVLEVSDLIGSRLMAHQQF